MSVMTYPAWIKVYNKSMLVKEAHALVENNTEATAPIY